MIPVLLLLRNKISGKVKEIESILPYSGATLARVLPGSSNETFDLLFVWHHQRQNNPTKKMVESIFELIQNGECAF